MDSGFRWNDRRSYPNVIPARAGIQTSYPELGHRICFVVGHLKYREYVCVPSASHLQHPVNAYSSVGCGKTGVVTP